MEGLLDLEFMEIYNFVYLAKNKAPKSSIAPIKEDGKLGGKVKAEANNMASFC